jgi:hypothetical protein
VEEAQAEVAAAGVMSADNRQLSSSSVFGGGKGEGQGEGQYEEEWEVEVWEEGEEDV